MAIINLYITTEKTITLDDVYAACVENMSSALRMHERIKKELSQLAI